MYYFVARLNEIFEETVIPFFIRLMAIVSGALLIVSPAAAADAKFPPLVKIVVPFGPGGSNDVVARDCGAAREAAGNQRDRRQQGRGFGDYRQ